MVLVCGGVVAVVLCLCLNWQQEQHYRKYCLSPMPVAVQRKEQSAADALYQQVKQAMESGQPRLLELTCEKEESKRVTLLTSEVVAVQTYEKSAMGGGSKRPGFSFDG